jgi:hypothetical protein
VGPKVGMNVLEKDLFPLPRMESRFLDRPARSQFTAPHPKNRPVQIIPARRQKAKATKDTHSSPASKYRALLSSYQTAPRICYELCTYSRFDKQLI